MISLAEFLKAVAIGLLVGGVATSCWGVFGHVPKLQSLGDALVAVGYGIGFISRVLAGDLGWAVLYGVLAIYFAWKWWKNRRNGKRRKTLRELGAKSRARLQALVDQMTPSPIPSPVGGYA